MILALYKYALRNFANTVVKKNRPFNIIDLYQYISTCRGVGKKGGGAMGQCAKTDQIIQK